MCNTKRRSCWRTNCARRWRPASRRCASAVKHVKLRSTARISAAISARRAPAVDRIDRQLIDNQSNNRPVVVAMRERGGRTLAQVFPAEADAVTTIRGRIDEGTTVHADERPAWNPLHASFSMRRINHQDGYSIDDACTNGAESYFSRLRRGELGHHHHIAGPYLVRYAPGKPPGARIRAASATASRFMVWPAWRWDAGLRSILCATVSNRARAA